MTEFLAQFIVPITITASIIGSVGVLALIIILRDKISGIHFSRAGFEIRTNDVPTWKQIICKIDRIDANTRKTIRKSVVMPSGMKSKIAAGLLLILFGMMIGYGAHSIPTGLPNKTPVVKPSSESLEEFIIREVKTLPADERHKLADVTEKILEQHFSRPSELAEEFSLQRKLAGIDSSAFQTFSKKWAAKVEQAQPQTVEALKQVYQSLLEGLKNEELGVRSQELEE